MPIIYRSTKGSPLSIAEADGNFAYLNDQLVAKLDSTAYTAADVLAKLLTVDGSGSGLDADRLDGLTSATTNTVSTIVARDASGNFAANTITANLTGNVTGNVTGNLTGTVTGNATNVSGVVSVVNGGTGVSDVAGIKTLLSLGTLSTQAANSVNITGGSISGLTTPLPIASGGTGGGDKNAARTSLGLVIGTDVQAQSAILTGLSAIPSNSLGILVRDANGTATVRSLAVGTGLTLTNANGVSGNPTISIGDISLSSSSTAVTQLAGDNSTKLATTAFVKTAVDTSATTLTNYVNTSVSTALTTANLANRVKAYVNFDVVISYQGGLFNGVVTINNSLGVTAVTYQGIYNQTQSNVTTGCYIFRVTLNNGVVSDGQYIVSGSTSQLSLGSYTPFSINNVNTTRFDIYAYLTTNGGNVRAMVVA